MTYHKCDKDAYSVNLGTSHIVDGIGEVINATFEIASVLTHYTAGSTKPGTPRPPATAAEPAPAAPAPSTATPASGAAKPHADKPTDATCAPPMTVAVHYGMQTVTNVFELLANGVRDVTTVTSRPRPCHCVPAP
jgi:hypothetical protein